MVVPAVRIGLPDLDQGVPHHAAGAVEDHAFEPNPLALGREISLIELEYALHRRMRGQELCDLVKGRRALGVFHLQRDAGRVKDLR